MSAKRNTLSINKFKELVENKNYKIVKYYCVGVDDCLFVELESPFYQKIFFIYINPQYKLSVPSNEEIQYIRDISNTPLIQTTYWKSIADVDFVSVSTYYMAYVTHLGEHHSYELLEEPYEEIKKPDDVIANLEQRAQQFNINHKSGRSLVTPHDNLKVVQQQKNVNIVFQDDRGNAVDADNPVEQMIEHAKREKDVELVTRSPQQVNDGFNSLSKDEGGDEVLMFSSSSEENLGLVPIKPYSVIEEEEECDVGQIYICVDIKKFFQNIKSFDEYLTVQYDTLYAKEEDVNRANFQEIMSMIDVYKDSLKREYDNINAQNKEDMKQMKRLSKVLIQTNNTLKADPANEGLQQVYSESYALLRGVNSRIIERRDRLFCFINDSKAYLKDLMI